MANPRSDDDFTEAVVRLVQALGRRCADGDPDTARLLLLIDQELRNALSRAVLSWRRHGFTDQQIGRELGVTRQAVEKRWPRGNLRLPQKRR